MKSTGVVRNIDQLGRFVLPREIRKTMELETGDAIEIYVEEDRIILRKYAPSCIFCGEAQDVTLFHSKLVCRGCMEALKKV